MRWQRSSWKQKENGMTVKDCKKSRKKKEMTPAQHAIDSCKND